MFMISAAQAAALFFSEVIQSFLKFCLICYSESFSKLNLVLFLLAQSEQ